MGLRKKSKSPAVFSHEFVIQNHADIVSCVAMVILLGLMFEITAKFAIMFITVQYNVTYTDVDEGNDSISYYVYGFKDLATIFFYMLIAIILHAVIQEYILDKINRRLHLSKTKHSKFNESGQLAFFYLFSFLWGSSILTGEKFTTDPTLLWEKYPHLHMFFQVKFFYICQIAYWLHALPELYFQKVRKEDIARQLYYICLYIFQITGAYILTEPANITVPKAFLDEMNINQISVAVYWVMLKFTTSHLKVNCGACFVLVIASTMSRLLVPVIAFLMNSTNVATSSLHRLGLILLVPHYLVELLFHASRLFYFSDENKQKGFTLWALLFVMARLLTLTLSVLTFGFGLARAENQDFSVANGNFNTLTIRISCLAAICLTQAWMMWKFINFQLKKWREHAQNQIPKKKVANAKNKQSKKEHKSNASNGTLKTECGTSPRARKAKAS